MNRTWICEILLFYITIKAFVASFTCFWVSNFSTQWVKGFRVKRFKSVANTELFDVGISENFTDSGKGLYKLKY